MRQPEGQDDPILQGLPGVPKDAEVRAQRRCECHCGEGAGSGHAGVCDAHLLLRDERPDEDPAGQAQPSLPVGLSVPQRVHDVRRGGG